MYGDLGLHDAEKLKIKTGLVIEIRKAMRKLGLTQKEAAARMGITQPKVSDMMRGDFSNLSERKLMDCLTRLRESCGTTSGRLPEAVPAHVEAHLENMRFELALRGPGRPPVPKSDSRRIS